MSITYNQNICSKKKVKKVFRGKTLGNENKGHKTKCNKMEDDRKRLYMLIFNQLERN